MLTTEEKVLNNGSDSIGGNKGSILGEKMEKYIWLHKWLEGEGNKDRSGATSLV